MIPKEIKSSITSPIKLFFLSGYRRESLSKDLSTEFEKIRIVMKMAALRWTKYKYIDTIPTTSDDNITAKVVKVLRNGLNFK